MAANLIDSSYWYNRNLVIIANIERQFLELKDLKEIHYYFGAHRPKNKMITHLKVQMEIPMSQYHLGRRFKQVNLTKVFFCAASYNVYRPQAQIS